MNELQTDDDLARITEENAKLRADLLAENERLTAALSESRGAGVEAVGLTDEDVRRLEHPDEFSGEAAKAENERLSADLDSLRAKLDQLQSGTDTAQADARTEPGYLGPAEPAQPGNIDRDASAQVAEPGGQATNDTSSTAPSTAQTGPAV